MALWLLLAPVPSAITRDGGVHAARLLLLLPVLMIIVAQGMSQIIKRSKYLGIVVLLVYFVFAGYNLAYYFSVYRIESSVPYQWGFSEVIRTALAASPKYDRVIVDVGNDSALMAYLFTTQLNPAEFQKMMPIHLEVIDPGIEFHRFGNIYLLQPGVRNWTELKLDGRNLLITKADQMAVDRLPRQGTIFYPNANAGFYLIDKSD